ncbi:MAG: hypothetical protein ABIL01_29680 [Pseudomonadota bacterium]
MEFAIALIGLTVPIVGNASELTYSPPRWPVLVIGVALLVVAMILLMVLHE